MGWRSRQTAGFTSVWASEYGLVELAPDIEGALNVGPVSPELFQSYLAAADLIATARSKSPHKKSVWDQGATGAQLIERVLGDDSKPISLRVLAAKMVTDPNDKGLHQTLMKVARGSEPRLQVEALQTLAQSSNQATAAMFQELAADANHPPNVRAEAILALSRVGAAIASLTNLLNDSVEAVQVETARSLRLVADQEPVRQFLEEKHAELSKNSISQPLREQVSLALFGAENAAQSRKEPRPTSDEDWIAMVSQDGNPENSRRVFFHPTSTCSTCHRIEGRGGQAGPDLSLIARSSDRAKLVQSILHPSRDIAPQFVAYTVRTKDDESHVGLLHGLGPDGAMTLILADGRRITVPASNISSAPASSVSLMPEGLINAITVHDFRDLVLFLNSLK